MSAKIFHRNFDRLWSLSKDLFQALMSILSTGFQVKDVLYLLTALLISVPSHGQQACGSVHSSVAGLGHQRRFVLPLEIQKYHEILKSSSDVDSRERLRSLDALVTQLEKMRFKDVETSTQSLQIESAQIAAIKEFSKGLLSVEDVLKNPAFERAYSLGVSSVRGQYEILVDRKKLIHWTEAYRQFQIDWNVVLNHTEVFMQKLTSSATPVLFFLPADILTHPEARVTRQELLWLLRNSERMNNVYFVLGAYDLVTPEMVELRMQAGISDSMFRSLIVRALGGHSSQWDGI